MLTPFTVFGISSLKVLYLSFTMSCSRILLIAFLSRLKVSSIGFRVGL